MIGSGAVRNEREEAWVYATPRREAIDGVDLVTVVIPKV
jgi:hypothetical protein